MALREERVKRDQSVGDLYTTPNLSDYQQNEHMDEDDSSSLDEPVLLLDSSSYASRRSASFQETQPPAYPQHHHQQQQQQPEPSLLSDPKVRSRTLTRPSRLEIPRATSCRKNPPEWPMTRLQAPTVNRLEVEKEFLQNQNNSLNKDLQQCRETVLALKHILAQREETIERLKEESRQAYLKSNFLESVLAEHQGLWQRNLMQGYRGQEEHRQGMLLRELRESELFDDEEDSTVEDAEEDDFGEARRGMNHQQPYSDDDGDDLSEEYSEESDSDYGGRSAPTPGRRFRELNIGQSPPETHTPQTPSNVQNSLHTNLSPEVFPDVPQQHSASLPSRHMNDSNALANSPPVLRRRPRLQINSGFNEVTYSPAPSSLQGLASYRAMPSDNSEPSLSSSSRSSDRDGSVTDEDRAGDSVEESVKQDDQCGLRDSGHFPAEIFPSDTIVALGDTKAIEQQHPVVVAEVIVTSAASGSRAFGGGDVDGADFDGGGISIQRDSEVSLEEDRAEPSAGTIVSPNAEVSDPPFTAHALITCLPETVSEVAITQGSLLSDRFKNVADDSGRECEVNADKTAAADVLFMLPQEAATSKAAASKGPPESVTEAGGFRSTTTFLMRVFSGLGKQTAGVFSGRQYPNGARQQQERQIAVRSPSPSQQASDPLRKNTLRVTGKGIGIRRLAHRRSRTLLTSPVSVVVTGGIARADKGPSYQIQG